MCCFSRPIQSVKATKIFARLSKQATQYIVYQMDYESAVENAMILPIPTRASANEDSVKFVDLHSYPDFFEDLELNFPSLQLLRTLSGALPPSDAADGAPLKVQKVGNFVASVVPKVEDFRRLDPQFSIAPEIWAKIPTYQDYSFVVFKLEQLKGRPHPMAFEFETRHQEKIFLPTVHIHDGQVHDREEFDHVLYCQHPKLDAGANEYTNEIDLNTGWTRSKAVAASTVNIEETQNIVEGNQLIHRQRMRGLRANQDIEVSLAKLPAARKSSLLKNPNQWIPSLIGVTALVGAASLSWIIKRRNERAGSQN
jgi:hypothetical protein